MHGDDLYRVFGRVDPSFRMSALALPSALEIEREGAQTSNIVGPGEFDDGVKVRERARVPLAVPCRHDHSQVQALDREGDELHRREFGGKAMKRLDLHQSILRDGTGHLIRRRPQLEAPTA